MSGYPSGKPIDQVLALLDNLTQAELEHVAKTAAAAAASKASVVVPFTAEEKDQADRDFYNAMYTDLKKGSVAPQIKEYLARGGDVNATPWGASALFVVCSWNGDHKDADKEEAARLLLAAGADPNVYAYEDRPASDAGLTPLHQCAMSNMFFCVQAIVDAGSADLEKQSDKDKKGGLTALHYAASSAYGARSMENTGAKSIKILLAAGACVNSISGTKGFTPLHMTVGSSLVEKARALIEGKADLELKSKDKSATPLFLAFEQGPGSARGIVGVLLQGKANPNPVNADGETPLFIAMTKGGGATLNPDVELLLEAKVDVNALDSNGRNALMKGTSSGKLKLVNRLIEAKANPAQVDKEGWTLLHFAALRDQPDFIPIAKAHGVDVNAKNQKGQAALHLTIVMDSKKFIGGAVAAGGFDLDIKDSKGCTALHLAAATNDHGVLSSLLEAHADMNALEDNSRSPLHYAALEKEDSQENSINASLLIKARADMNLKDKDGKTALDLAEYADTHPKDPDTKKLWKRIGRGEGPPVLEVIKEALAHY